MARFAHFLLSSVLFLALTGTGMVGPVGSGPLVSLAQAQEKQKAGAKQDPARKKGKNEKDKPTDVTADSMEIFDDRNLVLFTGNVKAVQGDTTLYTDRLEVHTEKKKNEKGEENTRMSHWVATGNVRIVKPDMTITGKKAIMDVQKDIVTVEGDVVVTKPDATIRGEKLVANLKTNVARMVSASRKKRVHGVFR